jgi:hypothetical protein
MKSARLQRLYNLRTGRCFDVTLDHGFFNEPSFLAGIEDLPRAVAVLVEAAPDAMKRMAPGETNTWMFEAPGTDHGFRYSAKEPKTLWTFSRDNEQLWQRTDLGFEMDFRTITGSIFEPGFPDLLMQMWAAFLSERAGALGGRFGCATPDEAVAQHELRAAALASQRHQSVAAL